MSVENVSVRVKPAVLAVERLMKNAQVIAKNASMHATPASLHVRHASERDSYNCAQSFYF